MVSSTSNLIEMPTPPRIIGVTRGNFVEVERSDESSRGVLSLFYTKCMKAPLVMGTGRGMDERSVL